MGRVELTDEEIHDLISALTESQLFVEPYKERYQTLLNRLAAFQVAQHVDRVVGGLDRDRFRNRARALRQLSTQLAQLATMPDRVTKKDFEETTKLMDRAADDLDALLEANLPGCICRRIEHDNYSYLDYAKACQHHGEFCSRLDAIKADYEKHERALKDEVRLRFVTAALAGTATTGGQVVTRAFQIADEAIQQILKKPEAP